MWRERFTLLNDATPAKVLGCHSSKKNPIVLEMGGSTWGLITGGGGIRRRGIGNDNPTTAFLITCK
jgi:hypothetical protein